MFNTYNSPDKPNIRYKTFKPLAIVNLDIGEPIIIYPDDDIQYIVQKFCEENQLDNECVQFVSDTIINQIESKKSLKNIQYQRGDFLADSFGKPCKQLQEYNQESSYQTSNKSLTNQNEQQLAQNYERWQKIITDNQKQNNLRQNNSNQNNSHQNNSYQNTQQNSHQNNSYQNNSQTIIKQLKIPKLKEDVKNKQVINHSKYNTNSDRFNKLYQDGLEQYQMREQIQKLNTKQRGERELCLATFTPRISHKSKILIRRQKDLISQKAIHTENKSPNYTFRPQLSPNTLKIMAKNDTRSKSPSIHEKLYKEGAKSDRSKKLWAQDIFDKQHPFKTSNSKSPKQNYQQQQEAVKRLSIDQKDQQMKNNIMRQVSSHGLFQPQINKNQLYKQVSLKIDLQDKELVERLSIIQPQSLTPTSFASQAQTVTSLTYTPFHTRNHTRNLSKNKSDKEFEMTTKIIFDILDGDGDGFISATKLDLSQINGNVLELIAEILYQMEDEGLILNLQKFRNICTTSDINEQLVREFNALKNSGQFNIS